MSERQATEQQHPDEALRDAIINNNDLALLREAVAAGAILNGDRSERRTIPLPLSTAITHGNVSAAEYLIKEAKIDVNFVSKYGVGYLHEVCRTMHESEALTIARMLLEAGARVNLDRKTASSGSNETGDKDAGPTTEGSGGGEVVIYPIQTAVQVNSYEFTSLFLKYGADLTVTEDSFFGPLINATPVEAAVILKRGNALKAFIDYGLPVDGKLKQWSRCEHLTADALQHMLDAGFDPSDLSERNPVSAMPDVNSVLSAEGVTDEPPS